MYNCKFLVFLPRINKKSIIVMAFSPLGNSDYVVVSVSTDFPINSKWDALFHRIAYDHSCADWDGLCDHMRDVP